MPIYPDNCTVFKIDSSFSQNLARHLGEVVTVFTIGGGESGSGFTGILSLVTSDYITLVTSIGNAPSCALNNTYNLNISKKKHSKKHSSKEECFQRLGSSVDIPIDKIVSLVRNTY